MANQKQQQPLSPSSSKSSINGLIANGDGQTKNLSTVDDFGGQMNKTLKSNILRPSKSLPMDPRDDGEQHNDDDNNKNKNNNLGDDKIFKTYSF